MDLSRNLHVLPPTNALRTRLAVLRSTFTTSSAFREAALQIGRMLAERALEEHPAVVLGVSTPVENTFELAFPERSAALVPILRAGNALVEPFCELLPNPSVWHVGMSRDHETKRPRVYSNAIPKEVPPTKTCYVLDPMLATGGSAEEAVRLLAEGGASKVVFVGIVGAPEGVRRLHGTYPDVPVYLAALDRCLNDDAYILPGLGDFGDRYYNSL